MADDDDDASRPRSTRKLRSHCKSRNGCFNCKARKVKCQETKPACFNCERSDLRCRYPDRVAPGSALAHLRLQATPVKFSLADMRSFHQYMLVAYPYMPIGSDAVWHHEIPALGQQYEYLLHALLAVGQSHFTLCRGGDFSHDSAAHRLHAITGLNAASAQPSGALSAHDMNAMLAAVIALTFDSAYRGDDLAHFLALTRATWTMILQLHGSGHAPLLVHRELSAYKDYKARPPAAPADAIDVSEARASLAALEPLCVRPFQAQMLRHFGACLDVVTENPDQSYFKWMEFYHILNYMPPSEFEIFTDPRDEISQVLQAHFVGVEAVVNETISSMRARMTGAPGRSSALVLRRIYMRGSPFVRRHMAWPLRRIWRAWAVHFAHLETQVQAVAACVRMEELSLAASSELSFSVSPVGEESGESRSSSQPQWSSWNGSTEHVLEAESLPWERGGTEDGEYLSSAAG